MITIFILCYNEEVLLPFTLKFYRDRFPNCKICVVNNDSTDLTVEIAKSFGCEIYPYTSSNQLSDIMHQQMKNTVWKQASTDFVLIADCDELLMINEEQLRMEESIGTTIIKGEAYNMINMQDNLDIENIDYGYRNKEVALFYDKSLLFNKRYISDIHYNVGAHNCIPVGKAQYNTNTYRIFHYKHLSPDYQVARYKLYSSRLSKENLRKGYGGHYQESENTIRVQFEEFRKLATKII